MDGQQENRKTPFYELHVAAGARMVPFAGWIMPVQYEGIMAEHRAVREGVGLFDVSHMGEFLVEGPGAESFLQRMVSNDVSVLVPGQAQYSVACLPSGGIVDDLLVYKRASERFLVCVNAGRLAEDWEWFSSHHDADSDDCSLVDASEAYAQLAIQGRHSEAVVQQLTDMDLSAVETYRFVEGQVAGVEGIVARTGYTGEDGFELFFGAEHAESVWNAVLASGAPHGLVPIGLGARDTLRLEMKYCLYGNDISTETTPLEARLGWVTKLEKEVAFIGQESLAAQKEQGISRALVGFELRDRGIARHGCGVVVEGTKIGEVTSGTMSPSLGRAIGLCYLPRSHSRAGSRFEVEVRGKRIPAEVVKTPFYRRPY
ncbi:MAG: glycine cleavage system aminomethyltransferase GcvT [Myxococcota bacterium]|nr:glycine cleavage system aminomethyltransferase GcvT [Myxococcota bacterium]